MVYRVHFGCADLARTTIAQEPDPLWEVVLGLNMLQTDDGPTVFGAWRERTRARLTAVERDLLVLAPPVGYTPDFLTPAGAAEGLEAGLAEIRSTSPDRLTAELRKLAESVRLPRWTRRLAAGDPAVMERLIHGLRHFHRTKIAPQMPKIGTAVIREIEQQSEAVATNGFENLVSIMPEAVRWQAPLLTVDLPHVDRDLYLCGRGLRLIPSYFCWRYPIMLFDPQLPPVLVYPVRHDASAVVHVDPDRRAVGRGTDHAGAVADLIGRTRALVLRSISAGACSTSELASRTGISLASASEHARVLHRTGLVTTYRVGNAVRHTISPVGTKVLTGEH
ncbi:helix-turn-helix protein [Kribbella amoyensis]|uniref:Helix-turn-helix protein n=1 Tax=Kribbella amoyensis TaxID=996641 RepID=A0A561BKM0_9ACTN|nr:winged helix-turn-helix domain-containing protein [Kribbella amoyensis]TWD79373.1 helix-turn-helix protein [Kribbella amoyensis]